MSRVRAWLISVAIFIVLAGSYVVSADAFSSRSARFWALLLAGNWTADTTIPSVGKFLFTLSALLAIILNIGSFVAILTFLNWGWKLLRRLNQIETHLQERVMLLNDILALRDLSIRDSIITNLPPEQQNETLRTAIREGFKTGSAVWERDHIEILFGEKAQQVRDALAKAELKPG